MNEIIDDEWVETDLTQPDRVEASPEVIESKDEWVESPLGGGEAPPSGEGFTGALRDAAKNLAKYAIEVQRGPFDVSPITGETKVSETLVGLGRTVIGVSQAAKQNYLMMTDPEAAADYSEKVYEEKKFFEETPVGQSLYGVIGQQATGLLAGGGVGAALGMIPKASTTVLGRVASNTFLGGLIGASTVTKDEAEKVDSILASAGLSVSFSAGSELFRRYHNTAQRVLDASLENPALKDHVLAAKDLQRKGYPMSAADLTGDPIIRDLDQYATMATGSTRQALLFKKGQVDHAVNKLEQAVNDLGGKRNPAVVGERIKGAYKDLVKNLNEQRSTSFNHHMDEAKKIVGDRKVFSVINFKKKLDDMISEYGDPALGSSSSSIANELRRIREAFFAPTAKGGVVPVDKVDIDRFQKLLSSYTKKAAGDEKLFTTILDPKTDKTVANRLLSALKTDLTQSSKGFAGLGAEELRKARAAYAIGSKAISKLQYNALGKMLNTPDLYDGEAVFKRLISLNPSSKSKVVDVLDSVDPQIMNNARSTVLANALDRAKDPGNVINIDKVALSKYLPKGGDFDALFGDSSARRGITDAVNYLNIISKSPNPFKSSSVIKEAEAIGGNLSGLNQIFIVKSFIKYGAARKVADLVYAPGGKLALETLSRPDAYIVQDMKRNPEKYAAISALVLNIFEDKPEVSEATANIENKYNDMSENVGDLMSFGQK
jgi:hypothetical protein